MIKRQYERDVFALVLPLVFFLLLIIPTSAEDIPPGNSGADIMTLGGSPATTVDLNAPTGISNWELSPAGTGINTQVPTLQVKADGDWQVTVTDEGTATNGYMTEWDGTNYIGADPQTDPEQLDSVMSISVASGGNVETGSERALPTGGVIAIGPTTNNVFKDVSVTFKQPVSWNDKVLTGGHSYRIVVKFTISPYS